VSVHESGVHATVAGVALGLLTPIEPRYDSEKLRESANDLVTQFTEGRAETSREGEELANAALRELEELTRESQSPLARLEHALHPWTSYLIIPLFALANAGVELGGSAIADAVGSRVALGVIAGLIIGKPVGITIASYAAVRLGWASLPRETNWRQIIAVGMIAGIGFTVSLFITGLAFGEPGLIDEAKIGILAGSALIGSLGLFALARATVQPVDALAAPVAPPARQSGG
jgi:NhaA family Na+:H+ antiporter